MDLSSENAAYKSYIEQGKQAYEDGDLPRARNLLLKAADITNRIMIKSNNPDVKGEYYGITKTLLDFVRNKCRAQEQKQTVSPAPEVKEEVEIKPTLTLEQAMERLDTMIGLDQVKDTIKAWVDQIKVFKKRKANNLKTPEMSYHMVFTGNPGTGKTTVARIIGEIYKALGILSKGHLVEADRSKLVAGYIGQTGPQTAKIIEKSLGGVLFIDEAYTLAQGGENDFGNEAIATLLKYMEDKRSEFAVIVAGYEEPMSDFINSNPGLASRFKTYIKFDDYNGEQLYNIFAKFCQDSDYVITDDLKELLKRRFCLMYENRDKNFGNGRDVRNIFEKMVTKQARRISDDVDKVSVSEMMTFTAEDAIDI